MRCGLLCGFSPLPMGETEPRARLVVQTLHCNQTQNGNLITLKWKWRQIPQRPSAMVTLPLAPFGPGSCVHLQTRPYRPPDPPEVRKV